MDFRILGPLQVLEGETELQLGSPKERALLAMLLLQSGMVVGRESLIDALWGESPPPSAAKALNVHISHLRKALARNGHPLIVTRAPGYALEIDPDDVDATRFEQLVAEAREHIASNELPAASGLLRDALSLWRGPALDGVELETGARHEVARLEEARLTAKTDQIDCELRLGHHEQVVSQLEALIAEYPLRERLRGQYMLALYRAGRQAEALEAYQDARRALVEQLGLEPSEPLQRLERAILNHDPALELAQGTARRDADAPPHAHRRSQRRRVMTAVAGIAVIAAAAALGIVATAHRGSVRVLPNTVAVVDARSASLTRSIPVERRPDAVVATPGAVWVANRASGTLSRIDPNTFQVVRTIALGGFPGSLAVAGETLWVADAVTNSLAALNIGDNGRLRFYRDALPQSAMPSIDRVLVAADGALWSIRPWPPALVAIAGSSTKTPLPDIPTAAVADGDHVWVVSAPGGTVSVIGVQRGELVAHIHVGHTPVAVAVGGGTVWVANEGDDTITRIDPSIFAVKATIRLPTAPTALVADPADRALWIASSESGMLFRLDTRSNRITNAIHIGYRPGALAVSPGRVWLTVEPK